MFKTKRAIGTTDRYLVNVLAYVTVSDIRQIEVENVENSVYYIVKFKANEKQWRAMVPELNEICKNQLCFCM